MPHVRPTPETHLANVRHMMTHLRSYLCMLCGEVFFRGEELVKHAETHDSAEDIRRRKHVIEVDLADESTESDLDGDDTVDEDPFLLRPRRPVEIVDIDLTVSDDEEATDTVLPGESSCRTQVSMNVLNDKRKCRRQVAKAERFFNSPI